jgi:hypothetical protein
MRNALRLALALSAAPLVACGHASVLEQSYIDPRGGILVLHGDEEKAMEDARRHMSGHCGLGKYQIQRRFSAVIGSEAYASSQTDYGEQERGEKVGASETANTRQGSSTESAEAERRQLQGGSTTNEVSGVREVRETRITYACIP